MARSTIGKGYLTALVAFVTRFEKHQTKSLAEVEGEPEFRGVEVSIESGNRYDKVLRTVQRARPTNPEKTRTYAPEVMYFVDKVTGAIYGAKSPLAPNYTRYFGTVYNATKWDWFGDSAVNIVDETVEEVGEYGGVKHYRPVKAKKTESDPAPEAVVATA